MTLWPILAAALCVPIVATVNNASRFLRMLVIATGIVLLTTLARADQFDHLMNFPTEAAAQADPVVGKYWISDGQGGGSWRGDVVFAPVEVYTVTGTQTVTGPNGQTFQRPVKQDAAGWFLIISLTAIDPSLQAEPGCMLIADRDKALAGSTAFLDYVNPSITQAQLAATLISPTPAGSNYPFGNP